MRRRHLENSPPQKTNPCDVRSLRYVLRFGNLRFLLRRLHLLPAAGLIEIQMDRSTAKGDPIEVAACCVG